MKKPLIPVFVITAATMIAVLGVRHLRSNPAKSTSPEPAAEVSDPLSKEEALDLFRQLFALPAADHADIEAAAEAGRVEPELLRFHEELVEAQMVFDGEANLDGLPFVELADESRVYPILRESLSQRIRANLTQEDLNSLLPDIAALQQRISKYENAQTPDSPAEDEIVFQPVRLPNDGLLIALAKYEAGDATIEIPTSPEAGAQLLHFQLPGFLDGRHVSGARFGTKPFTSLHLQLTEEGAEILSQATETHAGNIFGILLDGKFHAAVAIGGRMETRQLQLPGKISEEQARQLIDSWSAAGAENANR